MKTSAALARLRGKPAPVTKNPLRKLAQQINDEHKAIGESFQAGLAHAIEAGKLLAEAKDSLQHGEWLPWVEKNCQFTRATAAAYMRVHQKYGNVKRVLHLSFREALKMLAQPDENVHFSSDSPEWYTPPEVLERAAKAMGKLELDPCADSERRVPAEKHFTPEDDGLTRDWFGKVYMNPPYGSEITGWVDKLFEQFESGNVTEAIALVPARVDTEWFRKFRDCAVCFIDGRLKFSGHDNSAPFPSALMYLGKNVRKFRAAFEDIGSVWMRLRD